MKPVPQPPLYIVVKLKTVARGVNRNFVVAYHNPHDPGLYTVVSAKLTYNTATELRDHLNDPAAKDIDEKYRPLMLED